MPRRHRINRQLTPAILFPPTYRETYPPRETQTERTHRLARERAEIRGALIECSVDHADRIAAVEMLLIRLAADQEAQAARIASLEAELDLHRRALEEGGDVILQLVKHAEAGATAADHPGDTATTPPAEL